MNISITLTHSDDSQQVISSTNCDNYEDIITLLKAFIVLAGCPGIEIGVERHEPVS